MACVMELLLGSDDEGQKSRGGTEPAGQACLQYAPSKPQGTTSGATSLPPMFLPTPHEPDLGMKHRNHRAEGAFSADNRGSLTLRDNQDPKSSISAVKLAAIVAAFIVILAILTWGPWNPQHVASNPGPSGTPGSTTFDKSPPPAGGPSGNTTGSAR